MVEQLDVARDDYRVQCFQAQPAILAPGAELPDRAPVGNASIFVADVGGKEFDKAEGCPLTGSGNDRRQVGESEAGQLMLFLLMTPGLIGDL